MRYYRPLVIVLSLLMVNVKAIGETGASGLLSVKIDTSGDNIPNENALTAGKRQFAGGLYHGVVMHNTDDDDSDGIVDDQDNIINGNSDLFDLFPMQIDVSMLQDTDTVTVSFLQISHRNVALFHEQQNHQKTSFISRPIRQQITFDVPELKRSPLLYIEVKDFANSHWNGEFETVIEAFRGTEKIDSVELAMRVAPWLMLSNASRAETLYIRQFKGRNDKMLEQLAEALPLSNTELFTIADHELYTPSNIWLQDTIEIGRQYTPFNTMPVVLQANRNKDIDNFSHNELLGPDYGWIRWSQYRDDYAKGLSGIGWMDWFGNLEVSPPLPGYPHGRMYYGESGEGNQLDPTIVENIAAQGLQAPFSIDVSYLMIKHADETISWIQGKDKRWYALVPSPNKLLSLAKELQQQGHGNEPILQPFLQNYSINKLLADTDTIVFNQQIEKGVLAKNNAILKQQLGIDQEQIVKIPAWFNQDGTSIIPNMVNSALVNGRLLVPEPYGPVVNGIDQFQQAFINALQDKAVEITFVDDQQYHRWWGNVHCATNVKRSGTEHIAPLLDK